MPTTAFQIQRPLGTPTTNYFIPQVRVNGQVQDAPAGWKIDASYLPQASGGGLQLTDATVNVTPKLDTSVSIPTASLGTDTYLLAAPNKWKLIAGTTDQYIPVYVI
jgi:hypothetical protein